MRFNFKRDLLFGHSTLGLADIVRHVNDFELAVARIEANATGEPPRQQDSIGYDPTVAPFSGQLEVYSPPKPIPPIYATADFLGDGYVQPTKRFSAYKLVGVSIATSVLGFIVVAAIVGSSQKLPVQLQAAIQPAKTAAPAKQDGTKEQSGQTSLPFPVPASFGIYALGNNKLTELHPLPIGIPDGRVALSAEIKQPSTTEITDSNPAFILFRRDLLNNAPQTVAVRRRGPRRSGNEDRQRQGNSDSNRGDVANSKCFTRTQGIASPRATGNGNSARG